jgi:hypothetical protein
MQKQDIMVSDNCRILYAARCINLHIDVNLNLALNDRFYGFLLIFTEVKVNENHIAKHTGVLGQQPPLVQPITNEVVEQMENKQPTAIKVETTKAVGH